MTQQELDALKALADAATPGPWLPSTNSREHFAAARAAVPALLAEVERLRVELADVLEIAIARGDSLGYESMDYCARLEQLRPDSEILAA